MYSAVDETKNHFMFQVYYLKNTYKAIAEIHNDFSQPSGKEDWKPGKDT